ncbi:unnamed protein product [Cylindrotheca closterium]|uniref:HSF-type DNA-binding domain-containing protein n=1 Tax=Cylindrotheca closterium TaxID=2856 RepID=A0AAD2PWC2_9STRA|nr:unnamed protein product [Cylindrotheca closterium]
MNNVTITKPKAAKTASTRLCFPQKVYNVLNLCEENHREHIVSWMNDGTAFKVHDLEQFEREMLPKYFNTQKYASFTRALCAHGFDCVRTGRQTGIYSHPKFNRNDPYAPSMIKRVKKANNTKALNKLSNRSNGLSSRDGGRSFVFPSLLNNTQTLMDEDANASGFAQLYQTVRSQIADRTTNALIRLPPGSQYVTSDEQSDDDSTGRQSPYNPIPNSHSSGRIHLAAIAERTDDPNLVTQNFVPTMDSPTRANLIWDEPEQHEQIAHNNCSVFGNNEPSIPLSSELRLPAESQILGDCDIAQDEDDFEPIPWSPEHTPLQNGCEHSHPDQDILLSCWEPRGIQEMTEESNELNSWYDAMPIIPKSRYQALYDFSSPVALPALFHYMDISTFGMCWAMFLIVGHTIQALFTAFGPNTQDLVLSPKISMLKHIFMDIMWMHSLLSAMVLVPEYFGSSSVMLAIAFISTQPPNLATSLKTHYHMNSQKGVPFVHGEWWIADIVRLIFLGYLIAILCICIGHCFTIANLKLIGIFILNLTPLFTCESYRMLLSIPARLEGRHGDKKYK